MAANSPIGVELISQEPERDFERLSLERTKKREFKPLQIRQRGEGIIWVVRTSEPSAPSPPSPPSDIFAAEPPPAPVASAKLDLSLEDLELD